MSVKHLNPRQGITTPLVLGTVTGAWGQSKCETPKSPPGDYNFSSPTITFTEIKACETPKSPPGDYNSGTSRRKSGTFAFACVKHLNPRQGITTAYRPFRLSDAVPLSCETPKSPPGDYNMARGRGCPLYVSGCETPKSPPGDYNFGVMFEPLKAETGEAGVKHLNPRQGITTM